MKKIGFLLAAIIKENIKIDIGRLYWMKKIGFL